MATREERIFSRYCLGSDGPFDNVGIDFDTAVEEEAPKNLPSGGGVADRLLRVVEKSIRLCLAKDQTAFLNYLAAKRPMTDGKLSWMDGEGQHRAREIGRVTRKRFLYALGFQSLRQRVHLARNGPDGQVQQGGGRLPR
jgi:hypothetical protein